MNALLYLHRKYFGSIIVYVTAATSQVMLNVGREFDVRPGLIGLEPYKWDLHNLKAALYLY
jgi:hypothetical protein